MESPVVEVIDTNVEDVYAGFRAGLLDPGVGVLLLEHFLERAERLHPGGLGRLPVRLGAQGMDLAEVRDRLHRDTLPPPPVRPALAFLVDALESVRPGYLRCVSAQIVFEETSGGPTVVALAVLDEFTGVA